MRKYHFFFALGVVSVTVALLLVALPVTLAQDSDATTPPFLAGFYDAWVTSAHAKADAEAFNHWNTEAEIPETCAKCHSTPGYLDFLGEDGSEFGKVDKPAAIGTVITCDACHNATASTMKKVTFPSGVEITDASGSARCMQCHQGRASGSTVDAAIDKAGLTDDLNKASPDLGFVNIHYFAAAATLYGSTAQGGYQFAGLSYDSKNQHVPGLNVCIGCHNQHTLEVRLDVCAGCHEDVKTTDDLRDIRMQSDELDYDGDGDVDEGIAGEIQTLQEMLMQAMQTYASEVAKTPLVYDANAYPYFFVDTNDNGKVDEGEAVADNGFKAFTGNLLRAAYNYQDTLKDPGGFAHNPNYQIELLYDSIAMLNGEISKPVDLTFAHRNPAAHFDSASEPFRHWDAQGEVPGPCAKCHTAGGLPQFLKNGVTVAVEPSASFACTTCHQDLVDFETYPVDKVTFPSGAVVTFGEGEKSNLCLNCHQGRESTVSVNKAITGASVGDDEVSDKLSFRNVHYFAAGASLFGTEAKGAYEFDGKDYNGRNMHAEDAPQVCTGCHFQHALTIRVDDCADCHDDVETQDDVLNIRMEAEDATPIDYDGDGDVTEPIRDEIASFEDGLLVAIQKYATDKAGAAIAYSSTAYPYFFNDLNANGTVDADEMDAKNAYVSWTPNLLRAAYNYQYVQKDPGTFAHNPDYIMQVLYDSVEAVGGADAVKGLARPPVKAADSQ